MLFDYHPESVLSIGYCHWATKIRAWSVRRTFQQARRDQPVESAGVRMDLGPSVDGEIDHGETGGGQVLAQALARIAVAAGDEHLGEHREARTVADQQQHLDRRPRL